MITTAQAVLFKQLGYQKILPIFISYSAAEVKKRSYSSSTGTVSVKSAGWRILGYLMISNMVRCTYLCYIIDTESDEAMVVELPLSMYSEKPSGRYLFEQYSAKRFKSLEIATGSIMGNVLKYDPKTENRSCRYGTYL